MNGVVELTRERRHRLQIYHEILWAIELEVINDSHVRPTKMQHLSNMSYDKLKRHFLELDKRDLVRIKDTGITLTDRGREFLRSYS